MVATEPPAINLNGKASFLPLQRFLDRLEGVTGSGESWSARCPAHDDQKASLSIAVLGNKVCFNCHAGCEGDAVIAAVGLNWSDLTTEKPKVRRDEIVAVYPYHDAEGNYCCEKVRKNPKSFAWRRADGKGGFIWKGARDGYPTLLYRLPEAIQSPAEEWVLLVEGEKDVDNIREKLQLAATCGPDGGSKGSVGKKFTAKHAEYLTDRRVAVIGDNDKAGRTLAAHEAALCQDIAKEVRLVELPGLKAKGDISDWIAAGGTRETLIELIEATPRFIPTDEVGPDASAEMKAAKALRDRAYAMGVPRNLKPIQFERPLTDGGNGERFQHYQGTRAKYVEKWDAWVVYSEDDGLWHESGPRALQLAKWTARFILLEAAGAAITPRLDGKSAEDLEAFAKRSESVGAARATLTLAAGLLPISHEDLDAEPYLLHCNNGVVDLRTGDLIEHRAEFLQTLSTGTNYVGVDKRSEIFETFAEEILPDTEVREFVQRLLGQSLIGEQQEHLLAIFHGNGANGKSTLLGVVEAVLGRYAHTGPPDLWVRDKSKHPTDIADLFRKRLVVTQETHSGAKLSEALVKGTTGGDRITARHMNQDFWSFLPSHTPVMVTNHRPRIDGLDEGIWRRLLLVPFETSIPKERRDKDLKQKLLAKPDAILAWLVRGCLAYQRTGLMPPAAVKASTDAYRQESDPIGRWIQQSVLVDPGIDEHWESNQALNDAYASWADVEGERSASRGEIAKRLRELGCGPGKKRVTIGESTSNLNGIKGARLR